MSAPPLRVGGGPARLLSLLHTIEQAGGRIQVAPDILSLGPLSRLWELEFVVRGGSELTELGRRAARAVKAGSQ